MCTTFWLDVTIGLGVAFGFIVWLLWAVNKY